MGFKNGFQGEEGITIWKIRVAEMVIFILQNVFEKKKKIRIKS